MSVKEFNQHNFQSEVMESEKTVLLDFWAPWCGPCRMMAPVLGEVAQKRPDITVGKVNVDEEPELAKQFGVMSIPLLVVMKDGKVVNKMTGARPVNTVLEML